MSHFDSHPAVCSPEWLRENIEGVRGEDSDYRLVEIDRYPESYDDWHIPGAVNIDWENDLTKGLGEGLVEQGELETLLGELGIGSETTVILYGDQANWFAAHGYWVLTYYGHTDVQLLDGGRRYWELNDFEQTTEVPEYSSTEYTIEDENEEIRADKSAVKEAVGDETPIIDVRNPQEYRGEKPPAEIPNTTEREGHIPTAENVPWGQAVNADGTLKHPKELQHIYDDYDEETIAYCRIGERSSVTWFVLHELLDVECRNYDGSWTEWGNDSETPVERATKTDGGEP